MDMKLFTHLEKAMVDVFGDSTLESKKIFSPGRVNLIGEHIDYNGGLVLPCALDIGTAAIIRKREDMQARFASTQMEVQVDADLHSLSYKDEDDWANYAKGVCKFLQDAGKEIGGFEIIFEGNLPTGAGLSSSASLELAMAGALNALFDLNLSKLEMVQVAQKAEREFVGVNCGIMDQFAIGFGKKDSAVLLNCDTLDYSNPPLELGDYVLIISNTNKQRGLADSKYNERRSECEKALEILNETKPAKSLGEYSESDFAQISHTLIEENLLKRARHAVFENARVKKSVECLKAGDLKGFGEAMNDSHKSLRDDYEVSCTELDVLAEAAQAHPACIGSRMTGAGFGGCTISLVSKDGVIDFRNNVGSVYAERTEYKADFYLANVSEGLHEVQ